ncbi:MAG: PKD domain-containing protein [Bacteroidetes bacterium]|nr:PKD domain-containing protein [Bacteroidota bacterium]
MFFKINFTTGSSDCDDTLHYNATASVVGGTPGNPPNEYTFHWSNGSTGTGTWDTINNIPPGTYSVTVSDDYSCTYDSIVVISKLSGIINSSNVKCKGGSDGWAAAQGIGGSTPYSYLWSNGASFPTGINPGLTADTFYVTITDHIGCTYVDSIIITEPSAGITLGFQTTQTTCNGSSGGTATVNASGGTLPYTYKWTGGSTSQTITGLIAGTYTVTVTDANGCTKTGNTQVSSPPAGTVTFKYGNSDCTSNGYWIKVTANGGTPSYTYSWSGGYGNTDSIFGLSVGNYSVTVHDANGCPFNGSVTLVALGVNVVFTNVSCYGEHDGHAVATAAGGNTPYSYEWKDMGSGLIISNINTLANQPIGLFQIKVTDANGCYVTKSDSIRQPPLLTIAAGNFITQNPGCHTGNGPCNGQIIVNPGGGTAPFTYQWNVPGTTNNITNLCGGNYFVTITDHNGCKQNGSTTLTKPAAIIVTTEKHDIDCNPPGNTGIITVTASGGTGSLSYSCQTGSVEDWVSSFVFNNLGGTSTYNVKVKDVNGCRAAPIPVTIVKPGFFSVSLDCHGPTVFGGSNGNINATVSGGTSPFTYLWSNGAQTEDISGIPAGSYSITVTDSKYCTVTANCDISNPGQLSVTLNPTQITCNGYKNGIVKATVTGGLTNYKYSWSTGHVVTTAALNDTLNNLGPGTYCVTVTDNNGTGISVNSCTVVNQPNVLTVSLNYIDHICPNANNGSIQATISGGTALYNYSWSNGSNGITAGLTAISNLFSGTYKLTITDQHGCTQIPQAVITNSTAPTSAFTVDTVCKGNPTTFTSTSSAGSAPLDTLIYRLGNGDSVKLKAPAISYNYIYSGDGTFNTKLRVKDTYGCYSGYSEAAALISPIPTARFYAGTSCFNTPLVCHDSSTNTMGLILSREWRFGIHDTIFDLLNPSFTFPHWGLDTVKLIVTNEIHCTDSMSVQVAIDSLPFPGFTYKPWDCHPGGIIFTDTSIANGTPPIGIWYWEFTGQSSSTAEEPVFIFPAPDATYPVSVTVTSSRGCSNTIQKPVVVGPVFTPDFITTNACIGQPTLFTSTSSGGSSGESLTTWFWNFGDGHSGIGDSATNVYPNPGTYTAMMFAGSNLGCNYFSHHPVVIDSVPIARFGVQALCTSDTAIFTDSSAYHGSSGYSWLWTFSSGNTVLGTSDLQNPKFKFPGPGTYQVTLVVTQVNGCSDSYSRQVDIYPLPLAGFTASNLCYLDATHFTDLSSAGASAWRWDFGVTGIPGDTSILQSPDYAFPSPGTYHISLIMKNENGCSDTLTSDVIIREKPSANFTLLNHCVNEPVQFQDQSVAHASSLDSWSWTFGDPATGFSNFSDFQNPQHHFLQAGVYPIRLIVVNSNGCSDIIIIADSIFPSPIARFEAPGECVGNTIHFQDNSLPVYGYITNWLWDFGDGGTSIQQDPNHSYLLDGTKTVRLIVTNSAGCHDTIVKSINIYSSPQAQFSYNLLCLNQPTHFADLSIPNSGSIDAWQWNFDNSSTGQNNISYAQNPYHQFTGPGIYHVFLRVTNTYGCWDTITVPLTVNDLPLTQFDYTKICYGDTTFFTNQTTPVAGISDWNWDFGDASQVSHLQDPYHIYPNSGTFYAILTATDQYGCSAVKGKEIIVYALPNPLFHIWDTCARMPVFFTNSSNGAGSPLTWFRWDFGDLSTQGDTSDLENPSYVYDTAGLYQVTLTAHNANGCVNTAIQPIHIAPSPFADFQWRDTCAGDPVYFTDLSSCFGANIDHWEWNFGDGTYSDQQNPMHIFYSPGTHFVSLLVTTNNGCWDEAVLPVQVYPPPHVSFEYYNYCLGDQTQFLGQVSVSHFPIDSWHWNFSDGTTADIQNPVHLFTNAAPYQVSLTVTDSKGCDSTFVKVIHIFNRPNAYFSPINNFCTGVTICFDNGSLSSTALLAGYKWDFGDPASGIHNLSFQEVPCHTFTAYGLFPVTLVVTDTNYCTDSAVVKILVKAPPVAGFTFDTVCAGQVTTLISSSLANGASLVSLNWNFGDPNSLANNTQHGDTVTHIFSSPGHFNVRLAISDSHGCYDTLYKEVWVRDLPEPQFEPLELCTGVSTQFHDMSVSSNGPVQQWDWFFTAGLTSGLKDPFVVFPSPDSYPVKLTVNDGYCTDSVTLNVFVVSQPLAHFGIDNLNHCVGQVTVFHDLSQAGFGNITIRKWNFGDGNTQNSPDPVMEHLYTDPGSYLVTLIVENSKGCLDTISDSIHVYPGPTADFEAEPVCDDDNTEFFNLSTPLPDILSYDWNFGDAGVPYLQNQSNQENPVHHYSSAGTFTVRLAIASIHGCPDTIFREVKVFHDPIADFAYDTACFGQPTLLTSTSFSPDNPIETWQWTTEGNSFTSSSADTSHIYLNWGYTTTRLTVSDAYGCHGSMIQSVLVDSLPNVHFTFADTCVTGIYGGLVQFTDHSDGNPGAITQWTWDFDDNSGSDTPDPLHYFYPQDVCYNVLLNVTNTRGCENSVIRQVCPPSPIVFDFTWDTVCYMDQTPLKPVIYGPESAIFPVVTWHWKFGADPNWYISTGPYPNSYQYQFPGSGLFTVSLVPEYLHGCGDTISHQVYVRPLPLVGFFWSAPVCEDNDIQFTSTDLALEDASIDSFSWEFGVTGATSAVPNPLYKYIDPYNYSVTHSVWDSYNCVNTSTQVITVHPIPSPSFTISSPPYCVGNQIGFDASASLGNGLIVSYLWNFENGHTYFSGSNPFAGQTFDTQGTYEITLIITNAYGCVDSVKQTIEIHPKPVPAFTWNDPLCAGETAVFDPTASVSNGGELWECQWWWDFGDPASGSLNNADLESPLHLYSLSGTYDVFMRIENTFGCWDIITESLIIHPIPHAGFTSDTACFGALSTLTDTSDTHGAMVTGRTWELDGSSPVSASFDTIKPPFSDWGWHTVKFTVTDEFTCSSFANGTVLVDSLPNVQFTFADTCVTGIYGGLVQFTDHSDGNPGAITRWTWDFNDNNGSDIPDPLHYFYPQDVCYDVLLNVTNTRGCDNSVIRQVCPPSPIVFDFNWDTVCDQQQMILKPVIYGPSGATVTTWHWNFRGDPNWYTSAGDFPFPFPVSDTFTVSLVPEYLHGCGDTVKRLVYVWPLPLAGFTYSIPACEDDSVQFTNTDLALGDAYLKFYHWDFGIPPFSDHPNPKFKYPDPNNYTVTHSVWDSHECMNSATQMITIHPKPIPSFTVSNPPYCVGNQIGFDASVTIGPVGSYYWKFGNGDTFLSNTNQFAYTTYSNSGTFEITLIITNIYGCVDSVKHTIDVYPKPVPQFSWNDPLCAGEIALFDTTGTIPNGGLSSACQWLWNFGDPNSGGGNSSSVPTPSHHYPIPDTFFVKMRVENIYGCWDTLTKTLIVHPIPHPGFTSDTVCVGFNTTLIDTSDTHGASVISRIWQFDGGNPVSAADDTLQLPFSSGFHMVKFTVTDEFTCSAFSVGSLLVDSLPIPDFSYQDTCVSGINGGMIQFHDLSEGNGYSIVKWYWQLDQNYYSFDQDPYYTYYPQGTYYPVSLTVTSDQGCTKSKSVNVYVPPPFTVDFNSANECLNNISIFTAGSSPDPLFNGPWQWDFGDGTTTTAAQPVTFHTYAAPGNYTSILVATNEKNCVDTAFHTFTIYPLPQASFVTTNACCLDSTVFTSTSVANAGSILNYSWNFGDPSPGSWTPAMVSASDTFHFYLPDENIYQAGLIVTNSNQCMDTVFETVYRCPCISADFTFSDLPCCQGYEIYFYDHSIVGSNSNIAYWLWDYGDGVIDSIPADNPVNPVEHVYTQAGKDTVILIVAVNIFNIWYYDTLSIPILINPTPVAGFTNDTVCFNDTTHFKNLTSFAGANGITYNWTFFDQNLPHVSQDTNPTHVFAPYADQYLTTLVALSDSGCADTLTQPVKIAPIPSIDITTDQSRYCGVPVMVTFIDSSTVTTGNIENYLFDFGGGGPVVNSPTGNITAWYYGIDQYTVIVVATSDQGCKSSATLTDIVKIYEQPIANFYASQYSIGKINPWVFLQDSSFYPPGYDIYWDLGDGAYGQGSLIRHKYPGIGDYQVIDSIVDPITLCWDTISKMINVYPEMTLYIPNAFTPDGSGRNDKFGPRGEDILPDQFLMMIYNRWGELLYTSHSIDEPWDGYYDNHSIIAPTGIYTYFIRVKDLWGERHDYKGWFMLLKKD